MTTKNPFNSLYYTIVLIALLSFIISLFGSASGDYILFKTGQVIGWTFDFIATIFFVLQGIAFKSHDPKRSLLKIYLMLEKSEG